MLDLNFYEKDNELIVVMKLTGNIDTDRGNIDKFVPVTFPNNFHYSQDNDEILIEYSSVSLNQVDFELRYKAGYYLTLNKYNLQVYSEDSFRELNLQSIPILDELYKRLEVRILKGCSYKTLYAIKVEEFSEYELTLLNIFTSNLIHRWKLTSDSQFIYTKTTRSKTGISKTRELSNIRIHSYIINENDSFIFSTIHEVEDLDRISRLIKNPTFVYKRFEVYYNNYLKIRNNIPIPIPEINTKIKENYDKRFNLAERVWDRSIVSILKLTGNLDQDTQNGLFIFCPDIRVLSFGNRYAIDISKDNIRSLVFPDDHLIYDKNLSKHNYVTNTQFSKVYKEI